MSKGKFAAYQRVQPVNWNIGNDLLNSEDQEFKHRAEDRLIADRRTAANNAKEAAKKAGLTRAKALKLYDTGSDSLNQSLAEGVSIATSEYNPVFEILDDTSGKYSQQDKIKANVKLQNLQTFPENTKLLTEGLMKEYKTYQEGVENGNVFRDEDYENKFQNGFKGITISIDDEGMPMAIFKGKRDVNGDGKTDELDVENLKSLQDAYARPQFMKKFNWDSMVTGLTDRLKSAVNKTDNGVTSVTTTEVETDKLNKSVKQLLFKEDGSLSGPMLSFLRQRGLDPNNPKDIEKVKSDFLNDAYINTERGVKTDVDGGAALKIKEYNDKKDNPKNTINSRPALIVNSSNGKPYYDDGRGAVVENNKTNRLAFKSNQTEPISIGEDSVTITNWYLDEKTKEITYKAIKNTYDPDNKSWNKKTIYGDLEGATDTEITAALSAEGFKYADDFRKALEAERDEKLGKTSKNTSNKLSKLPD